MVDEKYKIRLSDEWKTYIEKVPEGFEALGVVRRDAYEVGALLHHIHTKRFVQMNCSSYRSLPREEILKAIDEIFKEKQ